MRLFLFAVILTTSLADVRGGADEKLTFNRDDWDFNWQSYYQCAEPMELAAGTKIVMEAVHDNSADNFRNPSRPPRRVQWGEQTTDEMSAAVLQLSPVRESEGLKLLPLRQRIVGGILAR